jgi:hypothetical protein
MSPAELVRRCEILIYVGNGTVHRRFLDDTASEFNIILDK